MAVSPLLRERWPLATALLVPLLLLAAPPPLQLTGVAPSWPVLWLLPWALADGRRSGALAGLALGLLLDGLHGGGPSQAPALLLLGWWWGRLGREAPPIRRSFGLGLLALLGTLLLGLSLLLQRLVGLGDAAVPLASAQLLTPLLHTLLAQAVLTALLAPMLCSLLLLLWRQLVPGLRS
jgi:rod shape-determining protein MreD